MEGVCVWVPIVLAAAVKKLVFFQAKGGPSLVSVCLRGGDRGGTGVDGGDKGGTEATFPHASSADPV